MLFVHYGRVGTPKHLLPAEPIGHDKENVLGFVVFGGLRKRNGCRSGEKKQNRNMKYKKFGHSERFDPESSKQDSVHRPEYVLLRDVAIKWQLPRPHRSKGAG